MIKIDTEKCVGCSACVKDCFTNYINVIDGKAQVENGVCIKCGHCIAVCPKGAVSTEEYNMDEVGEYDKDSFSIESENLLNFIKFRRTVRQFKDKDVENEKILKIIEAGRFTQTGSNSQNVSYIVVKDNIEKLRSLVLESLKKKGEDILMSANKENPVFKRYANMWIRMYNEYKENPKAEDKLFFKAPALILVVSDSQVNGALASSNMELMTDALGLGTLFSGFTVRAAQENKEIMDMLGLKEDEQIVTCMIIGYPDVKYFRTVPRKKANVMWK